MTYKVHLTKVAKQDLSKALDYIEFSLHNPSAADKLLNNAETIIDSLAYMPARHPVIQDRVLSARGIRYVKVDNYLAFYFIDEEKCAVYVIRFLYGKRNWISILREGTKY